MRERGDAVGDPGGVREASRRENEEKCAGGAVLRRARETTGRAPSVPERDRPRVGRRPRACDGRRSGETVRGMREGGAEASRGGKEEADSSAASRPARDGRDAPTERQESLVVGMRARHYGMPTLGRSRDVAALAGVPVRGRASWLSRRWRQNVKLARATGNQSSKKSRRAARLFAVGCDKRENFGNLARNERLTICDHKTSSVFWPI